MEGAGGRVAVETTGGALERSAGRPAGPEVHQPGDCVGENLAVSSPARANDAPESGRTEESLSGRVESSPGVCAVGPRGGSDGLSFKDSAKGEWVRLGLFKSVSS